MLGDSVAPLRKILGVLVAVVITWYLFEVVIQPALVSISPIFADQSLSPGEFDIRHIDTPAQVAFVATLLVGVFTYYLFKILVFKGVDEFLETIEGLLVLFAIPIFIINGFLPEKYQFIDIKTGRTRNRIVKLVTRTVPLVTIRYRGKSIHQPNYA